MADEKYYDDLSTEEDEFLFSELEDMLSGLPTDDFLPAYEVLKEIRGRLEERDQKLEDAYDHVTELQYNSD